MPKSDLKTSCLTTCSHEKKVFMSRMYQINVEAPPSGAVRSSRTVFDWGRGFEYLAENPHKISAFNHNGADGLSKLSLDLFQRPRVLEILAAAFRRGLTRDTIWDLSGICEQELGCYAAAARVYKRGVLIRNLNVSPNEFPATSVASNSYKIEILSQVNECFESLEERDVLVVDSNIVANLPLALQPRAIAVEFSEANKNIETLATLTVMLRNQLDRLATSERKVFIVGGGVAGDLVGMASGLLGIRAHYVPTTLLSMADSSVGGKVGVNFDPWGKNQVGMFCNPQAVSICVNWLKTLPQSELRGGLVECLKHALLVGDMQLWEALYNCSESGLYGLSSDILAKVIQVKVDVVSRDPLEMGERAILNFGHTFGHVVEALALKEKKKILHGECVAVGMIHALRLSKKYFSMHTDPFMKNLVDGGFLPSQKRLWEILGTGSEFGKRREEIQGLMLADKKLNSDNLVRMVLLKSPGQMARDPHGGWSIPFAWDAAWFDLCETVLSLSEIR